MRLCVYYVHMYDKDFLPVFGYTELMCIMRDYGIDSTRILKQQIACGISDLLCLFQPYYIQSIIDLGSCYSCIFVPNIQSHIDLQICTAMRIQSFPVTVTKGIYINTSPALFI